LKCELHQKDVYFHFKKRVAYKLPTQAIWKDCYSRNTDSRLAQVSLSVVENFDNWILGITDSQFCLCKLTHLFCVELIRKKTIIFLKIIARMRIWEGWDSRKKVVWWLSTTCYPEIFWKVIRNISMGTRQSSDLDILFLVETYILLERVRWREKMRKTPSTIISFY
jgi:hypothetical protein